MHSCSKVPPGNAKGALCTVLYCSKFNREDDKASLQFHVLKKKIIESLYICMVTQIARVWINRIRLPMLLVVS